MGRDIELVIKIPEWKYKSICEGVEASKRCGVVGTDSNIHEAIYNGTLLPKGHGRIGDLDALRDEVSSWGMNDYEPSDFIDEIDKADTIIEADKSEMEKVCQK